MVKESAMTTVKGKVPHGKFILKCLNKDSVLSLLRDLKIQNFDVAIEKHSTNANSIAPGNLLQRREVYTLNALAKGKLEAGLEQCNQS